MGNAKKGQTLVEFALVLPVLFILLFGLVDLAWMFYVNLTMQHAVREGTRFAVTGRSNPGQSRREALIGKIRESSLGLYDKNLHDPKEPRVGVIDPAKVSFDNYTGTPAEGEPGARNEIIVVSLTYSCELLTPVLTPFMGDRYTFTVKSTMTNEPFDP